RPPCLGAKTLRERRDIDRVIHPADERRHGSECAFGGWLDLATVEAELQVLGGERIENGPQKAGFSNATRAVYVCNREGRIGRLHCVTERLKLRCAPHERAERGF